MTEWRLECPSCGTMGVFASTVSAKSDGYRDEEECLDCGVAVIVTYHFTIEAEAEVAPQKTLEGSA